MPNAIQLTIYSLVPRIPSHIQTNRNLVNFLLHEPPRAKTGLLPGCVLILPNVNQLIITHTLQPSAPDTVSYLDKSEPSEPPLPTPTRKDWSALKVCLCLTLISYTLPTFNSLVPRMPSHIQTSRNLVNLLFEHPRAKIGRLPRCV